MPRRAQQPLSYLDAPLDAMLGQMSHVRLLRQLAAQRTPVSPAVLAKDTRLDQSAVSRAIRRLGRLGVVERLGVGRTRLVTLNRDHPFAPVLEALFTAERAQRQALMAALRDAVLAMAPLPRAAWVEGPAATRTDNAHDVLRLCILIGVRERAAAQAQAEADLRELARRFDVRIDLVLRTQADLETLPDDERDALQSATLLHGALPMPQPTADPRHSAPRTHGDLDAKAHRHGHRVADALRDDPRLVERAQQWVAQRLANASEGERHALREWAEILTWPTHRLTAFLVDESERATRLRQTSPFVGLGVAPLSPSHD